MYRIYVLPVDNAKDQHSSDEEWVPQSTMNAKIRRVLLRQKNITVEGDGQVYKILKKQGFYKYLRKKVSGTEHTYSTKEAKQIVRNSSCFLAFTLIQGNVINWETILQSFNNLTSGEGIKVLYRYTEWLSGQYYKPSTITHNIDYIKLAVEWVVNDHSVPYSLSFNAYARTLRSKVTLL